MNSRMNDCIFIYLIRGILVTFILLLGFSTSNIVLAETTESFSKKRVLFISSYSSAFNTFYQQIEGVRDAFDDYPVTVDMEFMDTKRFYTNQNIENFYESLVYKLNYVSYDAVLTSDDNALDFVMEHKDELFANTPIFFFGVNSEIHALNYSQDPYVTGVVEEASIKETIDLALSLYPKAQSVIALTDNTPSGQSDLIRFYQEEDTFNHVAFETINMSELSMDQFLSALSEVDESSVVILLSALRDKDDESYDFEESLSLMLDVAKVPIFHLYEHGIGDGLIGGHVVSHFAQGEIAAKMAVSYFQGAPLSEISLVENGQNMYMIDHLVFDKYDLDESALPESTVIINKNISFYDRYHVYVNTTIGLVLGMTVVIALLSWALRNRNKARIIAENSRQKIELVNSVLREVNDELGYTSYHDGLTGLYNRNYFEKEIVLLDKPVNYPLSLIMGDLNGLKLINDAFGHINGDKALKGVAMILEEVFPDSMISRIGGDEYAVVSVGLDKQELEERMDLVRDKAEEILIQGVKLSVSLGCAVKTTQDVEIAEMYTRAENAMYREKMYQVPSNRSAIIDTIIATLNQKDIYSELHSKRVSAISTKIAKYLGLDDDTVGKVKTAGILHDIGKIIIPTNILMKTGKLTDDEYGIIKKHSEIGFRILNSVSSLRDIAEIVFCHHERIDGQGYPRGLTGIEIPIESRIIGVADAMDAMLSDRLYRKRLTKEACYQELVKYKGTQFCSMVVDVVLEYYDEIYTLVSNEIDMESGT